MKGDMSCFALVSYMLEENANLIKPILVKGAFLLVRLYVPSDSLHGGRYIKVC